MKKLATLNILSIVYLMDRPACVKRVRSGGEEGEDEAIRVNWRERYSTLSVPKVGCGTVRVQVQMESRLSMLCELSNSHA